MSTESILVATSGMYHVAVTSGACTSVAQFVVTDICPGCVEDGMCNMFCPLSTDVDCDDWKSIVYPIVGDQISYLITGTIAIGSTGLTIVDTLTGGSYNNDEFFIATQGTGSVSFSNGIFTVTNG